MARVVEGFHSFTCHPRVYPRTELKATGCTATLQATSGDYSPSEVLHLDRPERLPVSSQCRSPCTRHSVVLAPSSALQKVVVVQWPPGVDTGHTTADDHIVTLKKKISLKGLPKEGEVTWGSGGREGVVWGPCSPYAGASTPYKRWIKCTMEKVGGGFCRNLGEKCINFLYKIKNLLYWHSSTV